MSDSPLMEYHTSRSVIFQKNHLNLYHTKINATLDRGMRWSTNSTMPTLLKPLFTISRLSTAIGLILSFQNLVAESALLFRPRTLLGGEYWGNLPTDAYLDYLKAVKPDLIHGGVLGPELASCIHGKGTLKAITPIYPADAENMAAYHAWWRNYLEPIHRLGIKVQATFSVIALWGDSEANTGWFRYYNDLWEENLLGPRPAPRSELFLETDSEGRLLSEPAGSWRLYRGCVNNPLWRQTLKAMVRLGLETGFDGFMVQFPHWRGGCACSHCQQAFRDFLRARCSPEELAAMDLGALDRHVFATTAPRPGKTDRLDILAREFTAVSIKNCLDEVFLNYGRALRPDLLVSQWTHFRNFLAERSTAADFTAYVDERALLPLTRWAQGEDYVWYSSPIYSSDLKTGIVGDSALDGRALRAMAAGKPFLLLKYDYFRWRACAAEALAMGGILFGNWRGGWSGGTDREEPHLKTYFEFVRYLDPMLRGRQPYAEIGLLYPRRALFNGDASFFAPLRNIGRALIAGHFLFDLLMDERLTPETLAACRAVIVPSLRALSPETVGTLDAYRRKGGIVFAAVSGDKEMLPDEWMPLPHDPADRTALVRHIAAACASLSSFTAPWTVQVYADRRPHPPALLLHFVNFNRDESQPGKELPISAEPIQAELELPVEAPIRQVVFHTPEAGQSLPIEFRRKGNRLIFKTPRFVAYGLTVIEYDLPFPSP